MEREISRRGFLKNSVIALCTVAVCDFKGIGSAEQASGFKANLLEILLKGGLK